MTTDEVARYLRVSKASIYRLVKDREIPVSKIGRHLRFRKDVIDE
ncbi:MAG: helix-turn-helix domain-containing protein [Thermodesulfobacteriota bacterium]